MFNAVKDKICRTSLSKLFMMISDSYGLNMKKVHAIILSNVFLKNHCLQSTPRSNKELQQKISSHILFIGKIINIKNNK